MAEGKIAGGVVVPIVSPFDAGEGLDVGAFEAIVEHLVAAGVDGLLVTGTTGEAWKLDTDERRRLYRAAARQADGRICILAGTGAPSTRETEQLTAMAADCGCDGAAILTPWFLLPTPDGLARHYGDLAESKAIPDTFPLLFYHNPPRTHLDWPVEHIAELAHKLSRRFIGIKDSAHDPNRVAGLRKLGPKGFVIYSGAPHQRAEFAAAGADGAIEALINALPDEAVAAYHGDAQKAALYAEVFKVMTSGPNVIALLKRVMESLGLPAGRARRPHDRVDPARLDGMRQAIARGGRMAAGAADGARLGDGPDGVGGAHAVDRKRGQVHFPHIAIRMRDANVTDPTGQAPRPSGSDPGASKNVPVPFSSSGAGQGRAVHVLADGALDRCLTAEPLPASFTTLFRATDGDYRYSHHPAVTKFDGRYFAAWSAGRINEDSPGQVVRFATSEDGHAWSAPAQVMPAPEGKNRWTCGGFWAPGGRLHLLATCYTRARYVEGERTPGVCWEDLATEAFAWDGSAWRPAGLALADIYSNEAPRPLPDGRWLWPGANGRHDAVLALGSGERLDDWTVAVPGPRSGGWRLTEPSWFAAEDGALVALFRDDGGSKRLFRSESRDGGSTWSPPEATDLTDAQAKFCAVPLPAGSSARVALVCNPSPDALERRLLAVALSRDGRLFDRLLKLRCDGDARARLAGMHKQPGFQYPNATVADGRLWVVFSANKEDIELASVDLAALA